MSSADSTPLATPEGSIYTPTESSGSFSSFLHQHQSPPPTTTTTTPPDDDDYYDDEDEGSTDGDEAEEEWRESLQQLELLVSLVVIPFFGKWVGRRCAYWAWTKFMTWKHPAEALEAVVRDPTSLYRVGALGAISAVKAPL